MQKSKQEPSKSPGRYLMLLPENSGRDVWYIICFLTYAILDHSNWASFSNFNARPAKTTKRLLFSVLPDEICLISSS